MSSLQPREHSAQNRGTPEEKRARLNQDLGELRGNALVPQ